MLLSHTLVAAVGLFLGAVNAISPISTVGNKFFKSDGVQFFLKGVAYQLNTEDPLVDSVQCAADAALMKQLGVNSIRVYHVDSNATHDACMTVFADAGIYIFVDLDTFKTWLTPTETPWTDFQFHAFSKVMDAFQQYDNTLGFFIGNEVITSDDQSLTAPYIKVATRDMKAYRDSKGYRNIPIGYSAADIAQLRPMLQNYLVCGGVAADTIDFFGLNSYEWCGVDTYSGSGYQLLSEMSENYPVPIFFSETGCQTVKPRDFGDQAAILGPDMNGLWSGAIVYEWLEEANDYGLVSYNPQPSATRSGIPVPMTPDFANLQSQWATLNPTGTPLSVYEMKQNTTTPACPTATAGGWEVQGNPALPGRSSTLDGGSTYAMRSDIVTADSTSAAMETPTSVDSPTSSSAARGTVHTTTSTSHGTVTKGTPSNSGTQAPVQTTSAGDKVVPELLPMVAMLCTAFLHHLFL